MDYSLNEEQKILKRTAREFVRRHVPTSLVKELHQDPVGYKPDIWKKVVELGWTGWIIPTDYGGIGGGFIDLIVLLEEMGRACLTSPFFSTVVLGTTAVLEAGNEAQKRSILSEVARGDLLLTLAFSEPDVVNLLDRIQVVATADGEGYRIVGTKIFVPDAYISSYLICLAKTGKGSSLFLVDTKASGLNIEPMPTITGDKQHEVEFNGVRVNKDGIIGELDRGRKYMERVLPKATIARCAGMLGGAQRVLEMSVDYAKERVQFGKPIGANQAVQHHCADMLIYVEGMRYTTYKAAWRISQGLSCNKEIAVAKAWANESSQRITAIGHQVHGAIAFQHDHDLHLYSKQAKSGESSFGDTEHFEEVLAGEMGL